MTLEEEYAYEDDFDIDPELVEWLANIDNEWDCEWYGYYWDSGNSACGTEYIAVEETKISVTGEVLNFLTGEITQTTETSDLVATSSTTTGRLSTTGNDHDASVSTSGNYSILDRTLNSKHRAWVKVQTSKEADIQIMQHDSVGAIMEAQNTVVGEANTNTITIIQSD